jgi:hypothetical protein
MPDKMLDDIMSESLPPQMPDQVAPGKCEFVRVYVKYDALCQKQQRNMSDTISYVNDNVMSESMPGRMADRMPVRFG